MLDDRLDGFQADFSLLLGAGFADPDHTAAARGASNSWLVAKSDKCPVSFRFRFHFYGNGVYQELT